MEKSDKPSVDARACRTAAAFVLGLVLLDLLSIMLLPDFAGFATWLVKELPWLK